MGIIVFHNFTLLGMAPKIEAENLAIKLRPKHIVRQFNQVSFFTDEMKYREFMQHRMEQGNIRRYKEETLDEFIKYLHSPESERVYAGLRE